MRPAKKTAVLSVVAIVLAVVLARVDFSSTEQAAPAAGVLANTEFTLDDVKTELLLDVAPVDDAIALFTARSEANPGSYIDPGRTSGRSWSTRSRCCTR